MASTSIDTILTIGNKNLSDFSVVWSTQQDLTPGHGLASARRARGRRRLRLSSLTMALCLATHTRVAACSLTGGIFVFVMFLVVGTGALGHPLRHFEVYLGQWSMNGPGRAFRIIPILDGIGIAICINSLIRAICYCCVAGLAVLYVLRTITDERLPFTYCRDFNLIPYDPVQRKAQLIVSRGIMGRASSQKFILLNEDVNISDHNLRPFSNHTNIRKSRDRSYKNNTNANVNIVTTFSLVIEMCKEKYNSTYPPLYMTPAYNFFYVEIARLSDDPMRQTHNIPLIVTVIIIWLLLWFTLVIDKYKRGRLIWNNLASWLIAVPILWAGLLLGAAISQLDSEKLNIHRGLRFGHKEIFTSFGEALEMSLYIHAVSVGSEIILGKGLNRFASGHIDPLLFGENTVHSIAAVSVAALHCAGAALCAVSDAHPHAAGHIYDRVYDSTLWIMPLYSKCSIVKKYSHITSTVIFTGFIIIYMTVAYVFLKTALHIIFEYKVKLVYREQIVVAVVLLLCMGLSWIFIQKGGVPLLESVETLSAGLMVPLLCLLELASLLCVYGGRDFVSDLHIAAEDHTCAHITVKWNIIPFIIMVYLMLKVWTILDTELPQACVVAATIVMGFALLGVPLRACFNACIFVLPNRRRPT